MILLPADLLDALNYLPIGAQLVLPDKIEVERPGEPLGHLYRTPKGEIAYRSYTP